MDYFKRETVIKYTEQDLNAKCVSKKNRHKDTQKVKRSARRKIKENLKKILDFSSKDDIIDSESEE